MSISQPPSNAQALRLTRVLLESRRKMVQSQVDEARAYARYSHLAGFAAMGSALDEALALVDTLQDEPQLAKAGQTLVSTFMRRQNECDEARDAALTAERYDEVASHDGRGTGFLMALRIAQDEFQPARKGKPDQRRPGRPGSKSVR